MFAALGLANSTAISQDENDWLEAICDFLPMLFHASTLLHLQSLDFHPKANEVYSWRQGPILGGEKTPENVDIVPFAAHISSTGQLARKFAEGK